MATEQKPGLRVDGASASRQLGAADPTYPGDITAADPAFEHKVVTGATIATLARSTVQPAFNARKRGQPDKGGVKSGAAPSISSRGVRARISHFADFVYKPSTVNLTHHCTNLTMTKTIQAISEAVRTHKYPFPKVESHPGKPQKHRYERRKIRECLHLVNWLQETVEPVPNPTRAEL